MQFLGHPGVTSDDCWYTYSNYTCAKGTFQCFKHCLWRSVGMKQNNDHEFTYVIGCFQKGPTEVQFELDSEELMYADFDKDTAVFTLPDFLVLVPAKLANKTRILMDAKKAKRACLLLAEVLSVIEHLPPENKGKGHPLVLYSAEEVKFGAENTLVCFLNHFFPPSIKVSWTKNNQPVSEGVSLSRYYPNSDIYSCTVEHKALKRKSFSRLGRYCGVTVVLGCLGLAIGIYFIVKRRQTQYLPGIKRLYTRRLMRSGIFFFLIIVLLCLMSANPVSLQIV
uniref:Ig-like domain-containing protein n=1 Tax=Salarias fasciatus TaxID=181472 RepID=A0A672G7I4_SALFA